MWDFNYEVNGGRANLWLSIPYADKDEAKGLLRGIRWDASRRAWYCPADSGNVNILMKDREPKSWNLSCLPEGSRHWHSLKEHQKRLVFDMLKYRRRVVAAEMRTGKTIATLVALEALSVSAGERGEHLYAIWLAPLSGVVSVKQEIVKWGIKLPNITLELYNYEKLSKNYDPHNLLKNFKLAYDIAILDEGHRLKEESSNRSKLVRTFYETMANKAQKMGREDEFYIWLLSGTPSPKEPTDWWNLVEIVHPGFLPWGDRTKMLMNLADVIMEEYNGFKVPKVERWHSSKIQAFQEQYVSKIATVVLKSSVLDIPEKVTKLHRLRATGEQRRALAMIKDYCPDANTLLRKTMQISDGFVYTSNILELKEEGTLTTDETTNPKLVRLREHLAEFAEDARLCVLAGFSSSIDLITKTCVAEGWNVLRIDGRGYKFIPTTVLQFKRVWTVEGALSQMDQSREPNRHGRLVVVGHPKSVATGLELSATANIIYYSMVTDGEGMAQSSERAHSMNMRIEKGCTLHFYLNLQTDLRLYEQYQMKSLLLSLTMKELRTAIEEELCL